MISLFRNNIVDLPTNYSLSYFWCGGFMLSIFMVMQIVTGFVLSLFYDASCNFGLLVSWTDESLLNWFIRYLHIWGVTIIFFLLYMHMGRSLYYCSYNRIGVWNVGFVLYILVMVEAFLGYILPWHQMSYWAATVLTSIILSVPLVGQTLYNYVIGGFSVTVMETLVRVFPVHVSLGFVILGLIVVHLFYLHRSGSSCPLFFSNGYSDCVYFHLYFTVKDLLVFSWIILFLLYCLISFPDSVLDVEAYILANTLVTPVSIKPEWYFLAFYAMLRSIESKIGGLVLVIIFLLFLWLPTNNASSIYNIRRQLCFWFIVSLYLLLSYMGGCHAEYPYIMVSKICSMLLVGLLALYKGSNCLGGLIYSS